MGDFKLKKYLVTGGSSGIGLAVVKKLLEEGACVFTMGGKHLTNLEKLKKSYKERLCYGSFDLAHPELVKEIFEQVKKNNWKFDGLIYSAGISPLITIADFDLARCMQTYNVNLISFMAMLQYVMNDNYFKPHASVVCVSSVAAIVGGNRQYIYASSKAAMNIVVKSAAKELALRGTRINAVMPSVTRTEMVDELRKKSDAIDMNIKYKQPFGIIEPEQVSSTIMFLLSDESSGMSGTCIPVNNGEIY